MILFKKVRWKNFLSTGNNFLEIEFTRSKTTLISGENGTGKSTVLDAVCFGLFGKTYRKVNLPQLINSINTADMVVEIEFTIGKKEYLIRRGLLPRLFEIYVNGVMLNQDSKSRDYQKYLENSILKLNYKSFTQVVILGSSTFIPFMQLTAHDRRVIIEDLLDIQIFSTMNVLLKQRMVDLKDDMRDAEYKIELAKEKIGYQKKHIRKLKEISTENLGNKKAEVKTANAQVTKLQAEIDALNTDVEKLLAQVKDQTKVENTLLRLEELQTKIRRNSRRTKDEISFFEDTDNCPTCEQSIDEVFKKRTVEEKKSKINEYTEAVGQLESNVAEIETRLSEINEVMTEVRNVQADIAEKNTSVAAVNRYVAKIQSEIEQLMEQDDVTDDEKEKLTALREDLKDLKDRRQELIDDKHYYEIAYNLLRDSGIKTKIVKQYLPIMNKLVNKYLAAMDFFVNFTLDENFREKIKSRHRDDFSYGSFSEGEKLRIDLSLLFTWREVARMKNSANTNLLILDEVFDSSLDAAGTEEFLKLLHTIAGRTNVFVITHKADILTDKFDAQIRFEKKKGFTRIV